MRFPSPDVHNTIDLEPRADRRETPVSTVAFKFWQNGGGWRSCSRIDTYGPQATGVAQDHDVKYNILFQVISFADKNILSWITTRCHHSWTCDSIPILFQNFQKHFSSRLWRISHRWCRNVESKVESGNKTSNRRTLVRNAMLLLRFSFVKCFRTQEEQRAKKKTLLDFCGEPASV